MNEKNKLKHPREYYIEQMIERIRSDHHEAAAYLKKYAYTVKYQINKKYIVGTPEVLIEALLMGAKALETARAEAITEFANALHDEIAAALESNYKAKRERSKNDPDDYNDAFFNMIEGKIAALRGIDDFVSETVDKLKG
jgi:predicted HicB family RNase H-like nuclease